MVKDMVKHLTTTDNLNVKRYAAHALACSAANPKIRQMIREAGGLFPLVAMAKDTKVLKHTNTLAAVTSAIWKYAGNVENLKELTNLKTVQLMLSLLDHKSNKVKTNAVGTLSELVLFKENLSKLRLLGGIPILVNLLNSYHPPLLENVPLVLKVCAKEEESMAVIEEVDGVRLIWSLLKNKSPKIQTNAAWALVPCIKNAKDSGEMARSFVGGFELVLKLLKSNDSNVLAAACAVLAEIATDQVNLAILSEHAFIPMLVDLIHTEDETLQENLVNAITASCSLRKNCKELGRLGTITLLARYLAESPNLGVKRSAAQALFQLSKSSLICITMRNTAIVGFLTHAVTSSDQKLQEAAAGCLKNLRNVVFEAETHDLISKGFDADDEDEN